MKTKIFVFAGIASMLLTCQNMQAQVKYGVHAGINFDTQANIGQLWDNKDICQGYLVGGFLEYGINNNLSFQTELNFQMKGEKFNESVENKKIIVRREFNYISVPLLVKGTFCEELGLGEKWNVTGFTGPYVGYLTSARYDEKVGETITITEIDNQAEKSDWGMVFGGGVSYKLNNGCAIVSELRYEMGLGKIDKINSDLRNKVVGLTVGYQF